LNVTAKTDTGLVRSQNQDAYAVGELSPSLGWAVVCDGMGGPAGGNIASEMAVQTVAEGLNRLLHAESTAEEMHGAIAEVINAANLRIFEMGEANSDLTGMGTTLVLCILREGTLTVAHAGDSRAYLIQGADIKRLTSDHSLVQNMVERGEISKDEANTHPQRNIITRALGVSPEVDFDLAAHDISPESIILLCTDGLTNLCEDGEIAETIANEGAAGGPQALINLAIRRGGTDNITVVALQQ
jgi:protein phosphatase